MAIPLALAAAAFAVSTVVSPVAAIGALAVGLFFLLGARPVFWTMPAALLSGTAAAAGSPWSTRSGTSAASWARISSG